ncbi:MAG: hypothetical protein JO222_09270 [Frankiales bacterium]|nr:hypothetical protein [Frankiales bacterium]
MAYSYDAGSTTPTYAGLCEFNGKRINDGTFKSTTLPMLTDGPPRRDAMSPLPSDDGGISGDPFLDAWAFQIEGWLRTLNPDDVWAAISDLRSAFTVGAGYQQLKFKARGWAQARYLTARVTATPSITEPDLHLKKVPRRDFLISMEASDPRSYNADVLTSVSINRGSSANITNAGNYPTPIVAVFVGPLTNPQLDGPGASGRNRIRLKNSDGTDFVIAPGDSVTVNLNPSSATGVTILDNSGANQYPAAAALTASTIGPGTESWALTGDSGGGHVTVQIRDAWYGN